MSSYLSPQVHITFNCTTTFVINGMEQKLTSHESHQIKLLKIFNKRYPTSPTTHDIVLRKFTLQHYNTSFRKIYLRISHSPQKPQSYTPWSNFTRTIFPCVRKPIHGLNFLMAKLARQPNYHQLGVDFHKAQL